MRPWFAMPVFASLAGGVLWAMVFASRGGLAQLAQLVLALVGSALVAATWWLAWRLRRLRFRIVELAEARAELAQARRERPR